ncbi:glycosyltransferase family 4 protein [Neobacillus jeddahensis]|uniref:glycosyltransferase family 4 protein n=1 Tax=Neobacillus jeddahensis TaxID=1461580 RepID=UPI00058C30C8|nr:glycosyltransferase family 4 protein [Neobacillus jeddahensis]
MCNRKLHIVFVTKELGINKNTGGIGTYVWDLAKSIVKSNHNVTVVTEQTDERQELWMEGVRIICVSPETPANPYLNIKKYWSEFHRYRLDIVNTLNNINKEEKIDIVEFAEYRAESLFWNNKSIKTIVRWHTPLGWEFNLRKVLYYPINKIIRKYEIKCIEKANYISFPSGWMKEKVEEVLSVGNNSIVIPNGINIDEWNYEFTNNLFVKDNEINIVYAGTLNDRKGFKELIEAVQILRKKKYKINLYLIGRQSSSSRNYLEKNNLTNCEWLNIIDPLNRNLLNQYYAQSDICCFPSWFETVGIVNLEAMASKGIVISSTNSGMREIIEDGVNGYLVNPKDSNLLAKKIEEAINLNTDSKNKIQEKARETIEQSIANKVVSKQYLNLCLNLLQK